MGHKILIADDETEALDAVKKHLEYNGYIVIAANDGLEALEKIKQEEPDIILLDIEMPKLSGFQVLKEVRSSKLIRKWQPVIILSSKKEFDSLRQGYELEADFYITKPFNLAKISNAVETMASLIPLRKIDVQEELETTQQ